MAGCGGGGDSTSGSSDSNTLSVKLVWDAPTENEDGTALTDLAGYKIYYGTSSCSYGEPIVIVGNTTTYTISNLTSGTYYFAVTAYDAHGNESKYSNEVRYPDNYETEVYCN